MPPRGRAVAVTGACGFIGRNLVAQLELDASVERVIVCDVEQPSTAGPKTRFYEVDLTRPSVDARLAEILGAEEVEVLVHLALLSGPKHHPAWSHELQSVGTMHVVTACRERNIRKLVMRSDTILYGPRPENPSFLTEDHALRGMRGCAWARDRIEAEEEVRRFAASSKDTVVTVLRLAPVLGPSVRTWITGWLSHRFVPTVMGFDPLMQFLHEMDAVAAVSAAVERDAPGVLNVAADGVLPVSRVVRLAGRTALPVPHFVARRAGAAMWAAHLADAPPAFFAFLRFSCVADGARARERLGFVPAHTTREAVQDFGGALRLREARLLHEAAG